MKQIIYLKKNWNLVSFMFDVNLDELISNPNIIEIKSNNESYNVDLKEFNSLKKINLNKGYYIKCLQNEELIFEGNFLNQIKYNLKKGWNLIGYPFDYLYNVNNTSNSIIQIKSIDKSYNNKLTNFNTLKNLNSNEGYWLKSEQDFEFVIDNDNLIESYDIVIVGAGPAGCMVSKILSEDNKNLKIALLEKGSYKIIKHFNEKYRNILNWNDAMQDSNNSNAFLSNDSKTIWLGEGLGGGTLHFGLQYIDSKELYDEIPQVKLYLDKVNELTGVEKFNYDLNTNGLWRELYDKFIDDKDIIFHNNKIYSNDITNSKRYIASDLLKDINVDVKTNANVKNIVINNNVAQEIQLENNKIIRFNKLILCGGAIENVKMINQSNILTNLPIGKTVFDHAGVNFYYMPSDLDFSNYLPIGHLQVRSKDLKWQIYFSKVPNVPYLIVTIAQAKKESNTGQVLFDEDKSNIVLNHFNDFDKAETLVEAYNYINQKLNQLGYKNLEPKEIDTKFILDSYDSIYHYHGTCPFDKVVNKSNKVIGVDNLYISDISVLNKSVPGSTSVASMVLGYRFARIFNDNNILEIENQIIELEEENKKLENDKKNLYSKDRLRDIWKNENKMFVVIQNDGQLVGRGEKKVYDMGNYWRGRGHPVNLESYMDENSYWFTDYDFTNLLKNRHGSFSTWRISRGGAKEVGLFDDGSIDEKIKDNTEKIQNLKKNI